MTKSKLLLIGDHFISPQLMREKLGPLVDGYEVRELLTPFPLEPFRDIAEVHEASGSEEQIIEALEGVSLCIAHHAPFTARVLEQARELRLVIICRGGPVNVNLEAAAEKGITVGYTPGRNAAAAAEHTIAMILCALRGIPQADAALHKGEWNGDYTWETAGFELEGATVGLAGYGAIGRLVGRALQGFGSKILVYDPQTRIAAEENVEETSLQDLLERSDILSLHARETPQSRGMIGQKEIARMKRGSVIVNCARGSLLDYDALANALRSGHLFAAAADVFPEEPLPSDSPLLTLSNFVMTPHTGGGTRQAAEKAATIAAQELARFLSGEPIRFCATPAASKAV